MTAAPLAAQELVPPTGDWRTLETRWFAVHYPADAEAWTRDLATRLDAIRDSVAVRVGWAPTRRVTIVVTDPENLPNGSAWPAARQPAILLYPTAPRPVDQIGNHRGWGDKLAAHEFAHIAHLTRPARRRQWWWALAPDQPGPIVVGTPRWAIEGYATHIEGRITGSGRPFGAWRAALLRALAVDGALPSYAGMSATGGYKGGSYAYLVGSAFWDWLARTHGDTAMPLVFRRQTARTARGFDAAFAGVFGASPQTLYGRFTAEVTAAAIDAEDALAPSDTTQGRRLVRFRHDPGALAISPDGTRLAHALPGTAALPPRLVIVTADTARTDTAAARRDSVARAARRARDPLDVEAIRVDPPAPRVLHTLRADGGRVWRRPRFVTDSLLLVETFVRRRDDTRRPALFLWSLRDGRVRRVADDVGDADPSPDGREAVAIRCVGGRCDVVVVAFDGATVRTLLRGTPATRWAQPRWARDGAAIVLAGAGVDGTWRLALLDPRATAPTPRWLTPDDGVDRHSPAWFPDARRLAYVAEHGGLPDIVTGHVDSLARAGGEVRRTRVATSAWSPVVARDGALLYTREHATGHELRRLDTIDRVPAAIALADSLWPVRPAPRRPGVVLPAQPVAASRPYGLGPRAMRAFPTVAGGVDGVSTGVVLVGSDPVGRLGWGLTGLTSA
ncbi:MAG: hypothetical protein MUF40_03480, partial [Gemmatimonadaceae bacterium]|nr:hypothetical protein [Gemmatimonadaceae bacterium]